MKRYTLWSFILIVLAYISLAYINHGSGNIRIMPAGTNEERISILESFGWEVSEEAIEREEVQIPDPLDEVYREYNKLQTPIGLDLERFAGKQAVRYTYEVKNHKDAAGRQVRANLLVHDSQLVAGDIMVTAIDGFMHALNEKYYYTP